MKSGKLKTRQSGYATYDMTKAVVLLAFVGLIFFGWILNIIKLSECDFDAPYRCEVIHGIGMIPIVGMITGWLDVGK